MKKIVFWGAMIAACAASAGTYTWSGGSGGSLTDAANWTPAPSGAFTADDELVISTPAEITLDAAATVGTVVLNAAGAVSFTSAADAALAVTQVKNTGAGTATFACPVQFAGTYYVEQVGAVKFPGGATATYPDNTLRTAESTDRTRTLDGDFTFTADWVVNNVGDKPWIVPNGSVVHGQLFTGTQTGNSRILRIEEGGSAYFTVVTNGAKVGVMDIDGYLEASDEIIVQASGTSHFGRVGNVGTVKAKRIAKIANSLVWSFIPHLVVGSGGFGCLVKDYYWQLRTDTTVTAYENFEFLGVYRSGGAYDWGIGFSDPVQALTLTIDVPEGLTVQYGVSLRGNGGTVRKIGKGTLVMSDTFNGETGFTKPNTERTFVDEGTMRVLADGQFGRSYVEVADGARLEFGPNVTLANRVCGNGTIQLADGVTITAAAYPVNAKTVEFATAADTVTLEAPGSGVTAPFAFLTGVDAADLSHFSCSGGTLSLVGDALQLAYTPASGVYTWAGASGGDWATPGNWLVDGATPVSAPGSGDTILFQNDAALTVGGTSALTVTKIVTLSGAEVTFACPVAFAGTYLALNAAVPPKFAGGATATYPDASLTGMNGPSHTFSGAVTFTQDWTVPLQTARNYSFVVARGSTLTGKKLAAATYSSTLPELRIDEGAVATFDTVAVGGKLVFWLNGGKLVATGDVTLGGDATNRDFGFAYGNIGTVEGNGIYKSVTSVGLINVYVTNMVVGAGGFGMKKRDYTIRFMTDARIAAKDDMTIWEPQDLGSTAPKDTDWGLNLRSHTLTIDTAGHTVNFDSWTAPSNSVIVKEGAGEMVMQGRLKRHKGGTIVNGGTLTVTKTGMVSDGPVTVNGGAMLANPVVVAHPQQLTLKADAILKPAQNAYFDLTGGTLVLPDEGTVTVDMTDFSFVNGVATPVLAGVGAGDAAKFTALVPAGVSGAFSVADGFLSYTPTSGGGAAADLFWHPAGEAVWSDAVA
ncbi:MAG: hypothetical protein IJ658_08280, partial [Kiritimatiellae bacterium]|nr:hypothetical protein [Kiritimatiellia bacterium]